MTIDDLTPPAPPDLILEFLYTPLSDSCMHRPDTPDRSDRECRRRRGHPPDFHASGWPFMVWQ